MSRISASHTPQMQNLNVQGPLRMQVQEWGLYSISIQFPKLSVEWIDENDFIGAANHLDDIDNKFYF
jgi:hypothetical protein